MNLKRGLVFLGAFLLSWTHAALAEVQNVKVGGEIRIRPNYSKNIQGLGNDNVVLPVIATGVLFPAAAIALSATDSRQFTGIDTTTVKPSDDAFGFFEERVQVYVESDLTDNVFGRVTLEAEDVWGTYDVADNDTAFFQDRNFDVGVAEAYIQLSELYYSPLTVKVGRQYMHFGRGFMVSDIEKEHRFDAARATLDFYPVTIDTWYSKVDETGAFDHDREFWGVNAHYAADTWNVEGYVMGIQDQVSETDVEPVALGVRGDITPVEALDLWTELVYEDGTLLGHDLNAFAAQVGAMLKFKECPWLPEAKIEYTFASGGNDFDDTFVQFFEYNYYGYVFSPILSNLHILNAGLACYPAENMRGFFDFYYYRQDENLVQSLGDTFQDNGGVLALTNGTDKELGVEFDLGVDYQYTEDVATQLYAGWFVPGDAYDDVTQENTAFEIRGEILLNF